MIVFKKKDGKWWFKNSNILICVEENDEYKRCTITLVGDQDYSDYYQSYPNKSKKELLKTAVWSLSHMRHDSKVLQDMLKYLDKGNEIEFK